MSHFAGFRNLKAKQSRNNYCHHNGATGIQIEDGSENILVDGNRCEYNAQTFEYETGIWIDSSKNAAVRGNYIRGNKIGLMISSTTHAIVRNNLILENNRGMPNLFSARGLNIRDQSTNVLVVHNTLYRNGAAESTKGGVSIYEQSEAIFKNNIVSDTNAPVDLWIDEGSFTDYNAVFNDRPILVRWKGKGMSWIQYVTASGQDLHSVYANPLFVSPDTGDFRLKDASPCLNRGDFLTRTSSAGSGRVVAVEDARYFMEGFGLTAGDTVVIGGRPAIGITGVDYAINQIILERDLSWNEGDLISYQYYGSAPDIGAYGTTENSAQRPSAPTGLKIVQRAPDRPTRKL